MIPKLKNRKSPASPRRSRGRAKIVNLNSTNGFTFVELLVVMTIIVLLAAIGLASYSQVNKKARDSKRKSDLEQIRAALEIYRSDQSFYPPDADITCDAILDEGTSVYMNPIPCDPQSPSQDYAYDRDDTSNVAYTLQATMEVDDSGGTCGAGLNYCVKQP